MDVGRQRSSHSSTCGTPLESVRRDRALNRHGRGRRARDDGRLSEHLEQSGAWVAARASICLNQHPPSMPTPRHSQASDHSKITAQEIVKRGEGRRYNVTAADSRNVAHPQNRGISTPGAQPWVSSFSAQRENSRHMEEEVRTAAESVVMCKSWHWTVCR